MAFKTVPSPSCPEGDTRSQVHSQGTKKLKSGTTRQWRCRYVDEDGDTYQHFFSTREENETTRELLDRAIAMPTCGRDAHEGWRVDTNGTYDTAAGPRQRYRCSNPDDPAERHDVWFDGPHQKAIAAREAAKHRKAKRKATGLRKPAPIELRPAAVQHSYRYQLHRREPA